MGEFKILREYLEYLITQDEQKLNNIDNDEEILKIRDTKQYYLNIRRIIKELDNNIIEANQEFIKNYVKSFTLGTEEEKEFKANLTVSELLSFSKLKPFFDDQKLNLDEFPQYKVLLSKYNNMLSRIGDLIAFCELTESNIIQERETKVQNQKDTLTLFNDNGLKRKLSEQELEQLKNYIINSSLDDKDKFKLIGEIYREHLIFVKQEIDSLQKTKKVKDTKIIQPISEEAEKTEEIAKVQLSNDNINQIESVLRILEKYHIDESVITPRLRALQGVKIYLGNGEYKQAESLALANNMTLSEAKSIIEMLSLKRIYDDYTTLRTQLVLSDKDDFTCNLDLTRTAQEELIEQYNNTARQLDDYLSEKETDKELQLNSDCQFPELKGSKHIIIYLDSEEDVLKDVQNAIEVNNDNLKQIQEQLTRITKRTRNELLASSPIHRILPTKHITDFTDRFHPMSYRYRDIRIGVVELNPSQKNKEMLQEKYGLDNETRILLLTDIEYKRGNKEQVYSSINSKLSRESKRITKIKNIFAENFTPDTVREATNMIEGSCMITRKIKEINSGRSKK